MLRAPYLALQSVRFLRRLQLHVVRQGGVLMQGQPVVVITDQRLGLLGMGHLQHIHWKVVLGALAGRLLLVRNLGGGRGNGVFFLIR